MYEVGPDEFSERWAPYAIGVLRIVTALLFFEHGTAKFFGFPATSMAHPPMWSLIWVAGCFELIGGFLLLIGLWTRWVGLLLAGEMAVAYWTYHAPQSPFPLLNHGEPAVLFCFIFLLLFVIGAGEFSVDKIIARRSSPIEGYAAPGGERSLPEAADE
jgi:putative oxidoreductase